MMQKRIYESILDDFGPDERSRSNELRKNTQDSTYVAGEGKPYDDFFVRVKIRLADIPATPEYEYNFEGVIENIQSVLNANRFITDFSEIFLTSNDGTWKGEDLGYKGDMVRKEDWKTIVTDFYFDKGKQMQKGLFLNFSFNYNEFRSPVDIAKLLCKLHIVIELAERDFLTRCRFVGIWFKHSSFGIHSLISIHEDGLLQFIRCAGRVEPITDRNYSGYCQINKLFHLFFDGDGPRTYDRIFDWCKFDISRTLFDMVHTSIYGTSNLLETIIPYDQKNKIFTNGEFNFSKFLNSFIRQNTMNKTFFFFMWPIPDLNVKRNSLKAVRIPVYNSPEVEMDPRLSEDREVIIDYLLKNKVWGEDIEIIEENGKFSVTIYLSTITPDNEDVPIDLCACFYVDTNEHELPGNYQVSVPTMRKDVYTKWAEFMYDKYLTLIMPKESADIIMNQITEMFEHL